MNFTREELKEIEKVFDVMAGNLAQVHCSQINILTHLGKKADKHINKLFDEYATTFDIYRTISAKSKQMQEFRQE